MLYAGLDLSRKRLDFHLLDGEGATVEVGAAPPDADGLLGLTRRLDRHREPIRAAIESMNGARYRLSLSCNVPDGAEVRLVFVLLTPPREFQRELQILAAIVRLIMHANVRAGLLAARTEQAVLNELGDADRASPSVPPSSLRTVSRRP